MKKLLSLVAIAMLSIFFSNGLSAKDNKAGVPLVCDTVLQAPGLTADQIYNNVKIWFANSMRSANDVIQLDDPASKHVIGKAAIPMNVKNMTWYCLTGHIRYKIDIAARDGRYRVIMSNFMHEAPKDGWSEGPVYVNGPNPEVKGLHKRQNSEMQKRALPLCIDAIASTIVSLQDTMAGNASATEDEW